MGVPGHASADDGAMQDVEGGKQGGRAVAFIVVGQGGAFSPLQRKSGLGAVEHLDLTLLVDQDDDGVRVHVEADDILDLGSEGRIARPLEGSQAMRLETMFLPDALDGAQRNAEDIGHRPPGPVGDGTGRLGAGLWPRSAPRQGRWG